MEKNKENQMTKFPADFYFFIYFFFRQENKRRPQWDTQKGER